MSKIVVIGDSHSQLFSNLEKLNRGSWSDNDLDIFDVRWLGPVTYWRLSRDLNKFIDFDNSIIYRPHNDFETNTKVKNGDDIMISLGEIDIRCNIGKQNNSIDSIDYIIESIYKFYDSNKDHKIHIISIIPPIRENDCISINSDFPFIGSDSERLSNTLYFNDKLKEMSNKLDLGYFDLYTLYADKYGFLDTEKSDNIVHGLKTKELEKYIKKYFNI